MHQQIIKESLLQYSRYNSDISIICEDGQKIFSTRFLLGVFSPFLKNIFATLDNSETWSLYLPITAGSVVYLLNILAEGKAESNNRGALNAVLDCMNLLGISTGDTEQGEWELL